jgi:hypothetical protein
MRFLTAIGFALITIGLYAQTNENDKIFSNAHGLTRGTSLFFEVEGYDIFTCDHDDLYFDKTGIRIAKRKYKIDKENIGRVDSMLAIKHQYFVTDYKITDGLNQKSVFYFIPREDNKLKVIAFSRALDRDVQIERLFVKSIIDSSVPEYVYSQPNTDSLNFAGRYLYLGGACRWMGPHNVQCPDFGQISWAEFRSIEQAEQLTELNCQITASKGMGEVLGKDKVDVIFEGVETKALKIKYKIKIPRLIMGGSNLLIAYYVSAEIRGKNIACIMSQYTDDVNANNLAPLLGEVMKLKQ